jgi:hypothetical protein
MKKSFLAVLLLFLMTVQVYAQAGAGSPYYAVTKTDSLILPQLAPGLLYNNQNAPVDSITTDQSVLDALQYSVNTQNGFLIFPAPALSINFMPPNITVPIDLQTRGALTINTRDYGTRGSTQNTNGSFISGTNTFNLLGGVIDIHVGDDISIANESVNLGPAAPTNSLETPCGTPRSLTIANGYYYNACVPGNQICDYFAVEDDGLGGNSTPVDIHATNVFATSSIWYDVYISMVPTVNNHTAPIWRNCGLGDQYMGAAQPRTVVTYVPGSGYSLTLPCSFTTDPTTGTCAWASTGGGCIKPPHGWVYFQAGVITGIGVDRDNKGKGCTSPPTVNVSTISGVVGGSGASISISFLMEFEDAGYIWSTAPRQFNPVAHPTIARNDNLIATVSVLNGNIATLCLPGTGIGTVPCTPVYGVDTNVVSVYHSWTREFQTAMNSAGHGVSVVHVNCGTFDVEEPLSYNAASITVTGDDGWGVSFGAGDPCVNIKPFGNTYAFQDIAGNDHDNLSNLGFDGSNTTGGGYYQAYHGSHNSLTGIYDKNFACPVDYVATNGSDLTNLSGNLAWGYGCGTYSFASTYKSQQCCLRWSNIYHNDGTGTQGDSYRNAVGGMMHDGYQLDNVATLDVATLQCGYSDAWGYSYWIFDDTGHQYKFNLNDPSGSEFLGMHCAGEYGRAGGIHVDSCKAHCYDEPAGGGINGPVTGWALYVAQNAEFQWNRGHLSGAALGGVYCDGFCVVTDSSVVANSQQPKALGAGAWPAFYIGPDATNVQISRIRTVEPVAYNNPPLTQIAPVMISHLNTNGLISIDGNMFWGNINNRVISDLIDPASSETTTITAPFNIGDKTIQVSSCPPNITEWQTINDTSIGIIGAVNKCVSNVLTVTKALSVASVGSNDTLNIYNYLPPVRRIGLVVKCNPGASGLANQGGTPIYDCNQNIGGATVPLIIPSSGNMGNNGAVTLTTPLDTIYPNTYMFMPSVAIYQDATFTGQVTGTGGTGTGNYLSILSTPTGTINSMDGLIGAGITGGQAYVNGAVDPSNCVSGAIACYALSDLVAAIGPEPMSTGSTPGEYYAQCASTTQCTLFNNMYRSGNSFNSNLPQVPYPPVPFATTGPGPYTQRNANTVNLFGMTIPGYQIGPNDELRVQISATFTGNADNKLIYCTYNGYQFGSATFNSVTMSRWAGMLGFANGGVTNSQWPNLNGTNLINGGLGNSSSGLGAGSIQSWQDQPLVCNGNLQTSDLDWIAIRNVSVEYLAGTN